MKSYPQAIAGLLGLGFTAGFPILDEQELDEEFRRLFVEFTCRALERFDTDPAEGVKDFNHASVCRAFMKGGAA